MSTEAPSGRRDEPPAPTPWVLDVLLAIGVTLTVSVMIAAGGASDLWAHAWSVLLGAVLLVRRRYPVLVLVVSVLAFFGYYSTGNPPIGVAVPVAAAVFSAAERGRVLAAVVASGVVVTGSVGYRLATGQDPSLVIGYELPGHLILLACAIALGDSIRSRRELRRQSEEIATLVAERYEREAEQRVMGERLAIARELHDSIGHSLTVVNLHTEVAEEAAAADDREGVQEALGVISATTTSTFADLRRTVSGLRRTAATTPFPTERTSTPPQPPTERTGTPPQPPTERMPVSLANLDAATRPAHDAGLDVRTRVSVAAHVPTPVQAAAFRIVQESITNVIRHAHASRVTVEVTDGDGALDVVVENDELGPSPGSSTPTLPGHGMAGMRERAELLGGHFSAGPVSSGFRVWARLPLEQT